MFCLEGNDFCLFEKYGTWAVLLTVAKCLKLQTAQRLLSLGSLSPQLLRLQPPESPLVLHLSRCSRLSLQISSRIWPFPCL